MTIERGETGWTYLAVWERTAQQGHYMRVDPAEAPRIDAAVTRYQETGRDSVLELTTMAGNPYFLVASEVTAWKISTPESRARAHEIDRDIEREFESNGWQDS